MAVIRTGSGRHSIAPTLNFDFVRAKELDKRFTFSRDSNATYYNASGKIKTANASQPRFDHDPVTGESKGFLVEEARTNLELYPNHPENWVYTGYGDLSSFGNYVETPLEGLAVRSMIFINYNGTQCRRGSSQISSTSGTSYATSFYIKNISQGQNVTFYLGAANEPFGGLAGASIDFTASPVVWSSGISNNSNVTDYGIEDVGNGWYRAWLVATATTTNTWNPVFVSGATNVNPEIAVFGMQVEAGTMPTSLIPSDASFVSRGSRATYYDNEGRLRLSGEDQPIYSHIYNGHKWVPTGLQIEKYVVNYVTSDPSLKDMSSNCNRTRNAITAPDGSFASKFVPQNQSNLHRVGYYVDPAGVGAGHITFSGFFKAAGYRYIAINNWHSSSQGAGFDLEDGVVTALGPSVTHAQIENVGSGWYRCSISYITTTTNDTMNVEIRNTSGYSYESFTANGTDGIYTWGWQIEQKLWSGSYVYTDESARTRNTDISSSSTYTREQDRTTFRNFGDYFESNEMTSYLHASSDFEPEDNARYYALTEEADNANNRLLSYHNTQYRLLWRSDQVNEVVFQGADTWSNYPEIKQAFTWKGGVAKIADSTGNAQTDNSAGSELIFDNLHVGHSYDYASPICAHIKKLAFYEKALSHEELQELTEND